MNFRRPRNKRHVHGHDPPRQRRGPDRPLLLAPRQRGGAGTRRLLKDHAAVCRTETCTDGNSCAGRLLQPAARRLRFVHG